MKRLRRVKCLKCKNIKRFKRFKPQAFQAPSFKANPVRQLADSPALALNSIQG